MQTGHIPRIETRSCHGLLVATATSVGLLLTPQPSVAAGAEFVLATAGKAAATIVLPVSPKPEERSAAGELARTLRQMTGAEFRIAAEDSAPPGPQIHVGCTQAALAATGPLETSDLDADAVLMKCLPRERLLLLGRNPWGTEFAVARFLYLYGGVRWYLPTAIGEHVPQRPTFTVPALDRAEATAALLANGLRAEQERRAFLADVIDKEPLLKPVIPFESRASFTGMGTSPGLLWRLLVWCRNAHHADLATRLIAELGRPDPQSETATVAHALWEFQTAEPRNLLANGGFERTDAKPGDTSGADWESAGAPPGWSLWRRNPGEGKLQWVAAVQETYVALSASTGACFLQTATVSPGTLYVVLSDCRGKVRAESKAALTLSWQDAQGAWLDEAKHSTDLVGEVQDRWTATAVVGRAPERAATAVIMLFADNQTATDSLAFDNVRLFALP